LDPFYIRAWQVLPAGDANLLAYCFINTISPGHQAGFNGIKAKIEPFCHDEFCLFGSPIKVQDKDLIVKL
jgi:hypothetical protein